MDLEAHLETQLRKRIEEHACLEAQGDAAGLYGFIDPAIRISRDERFDFEPELTHSEIRQYIAPITSARVIEIKIEAFTGDGGSSRGHRPIALVLSKILYNERAEPSGFKTPWVLDNGEWYTTAVGRTNWASDP